MHIIFLIASPLLLLVTGILFTAYLRLPTRAAKLIGIFTICFAQIVLVAEILGSTYVLSHRELWLVLQALLLGAAGFLWWRSGRPSLNFHVIRPSVAGVRRSIRSYPLLWVLGIVVFFAYVIAAFLILYVAPNNNDGMTYHLARVGYWLQFDSLFPWETANIRQTTFPPNAEIALLWTILLRGTDQFAGFVQWVSALVSAIAIFGMGRILRFTRVQSVFPALIYLTLSEIYLQSTTVQNDLVISMLCVSALYLLLLGLQTRHYGSLLISGVAIGLSLGTKSTALFILPGLACAALLLWLTNPRESFKLFLVWGSSCLISVMIWGSYIYVLNIATFDNPLGSTDSTELSSATSDQAVNAFGSRLPFSKITYSRLDMIAINAPRYFTQILDFSSLSNVGQELTRVKYGLFDRIFDNTIIANAWTSGIWDWSTSKTTWWGAHEDTTWFGPLGAFLFIPGIVYGVYLGIKRRDIIPFGIALIFLVFLILHSAVQPYTPAKGRYYVLPITVAGVLMIWPTTLQKMSGQIIRLLIVVVAILVMGSNIILNSNKPLMGTQSVIGQDRLHTQSDNTGESALAVAIDSLVPDDENVILVGGFITEDYRFFGEFFTRYIVPIVLKNKHINSLEALRSEGPTFYLGQDRVYGEIKQVNYIIINEEVLSRWSPDTSGFELIACAIHVCIFRSLDVVRETEISSIRYEFDGTTPYDGWHLAENDANGVTYQWTARENTALGTVHLTHADVYQVKFRLIGAISEAILNSLELVANNVIIPLEQSSDSIYSALIPNEIVESEDGLLRLEIRTAEVVSPYAAGLGVDTRYLGVAVDWLTAEAVTIGTSIRTEFDALYPTNGFYSPEEGELSFQWTGGSINEITLPLKVESALSLRFLVTGEITPGSIENLSVFVDGNPVEMSYENTEQGTMFTGIVPQFTDIDHQVTITFQTLDPVSPRSLDSSHPDTRPLGLAFDWLTIEPE
jgi:hypothetical protein